MAKGVLYVMTCAVIGLLKIGKAETKQFNARMQSLENNGYANVTGLKRHFAIEVEDYSEKERLLHTIFSKSRIHTTEMFALDKHLVVQLLSSFDGTVIYPKESSKSTTFNAATEGLKHERKHKKELKLKKETKKKPIPRQKPKETVPHKKPPFRFSAVGIEVGEEIAFLNDPSKKAIVLNNAYVSYQGKAWNLSPLAKFLMGVDYEVQGPSKFTYKGKLLTDLRKERENNGEKD